MLHYRFTLINNHTWKVLLRHTAGHGWFRPGELRRNAEDPAAGIFSILNSLEAHRGADHAFTLKLHYPNLPGCNAQVPHSNPHSCAKNILVDAPCP